MEDVKEKLEIISNDWFLKEPLKYNILYSHRLVENNEMCCYFRTGKGRIEYNSNLCKELTMTELEDNLEIEVIRIILKHPYERVPENPVREALSKASDVTIAENCGKEKKLMDSRYYNLGKKLSYEEYYREIKKICNGQKMDRWGDFASSSKKRNAAFKAEEKAELWENSDEEKLKIDKMIEIAKKCNGFGSISSDLITMIVPEKDRKGIAQKILSSFRNNLLRSSYELTRTKPSRRYGEFFMGKKNEYIPKLLVAVDSSGSMTDRELKKIFGVVNEFFAKKIKCIKVIIFDTEIKQEFDFKNRSSKINILGRGGTNFQCAINYFKNNEYDGMIIFTDGIAAEPEIPCNKAKNILWVTISGYNLSHTWIGKYKNIKMEYVERKTA